MHFVLHFNGESKTSRMYVKNFQHFFIFVLKFKKLQREGLVLAQPRIRGPGLQYSPWKSYEEPLQPSCLGKNKNSQRETNGNLQLGFTIYGMLNYAGCLIHMVFLSFFVTL